MKFSAWRKLHAMFVVLLQPSLYICLIVAGALLYLAHQFLNITFGFHQVVVRDDTQRFLISPFS